jgi:3D (Asp-Asp-Asp) domain-containing protein
VCTAVLVVGAGSQSAGGASDERSLRASLATAERAAVLELYAAESGLARARAARIRLERRREALGAAHARARSHAQIVRRSLAATHTRIGTVLRRLYIDGDAEPLAVLLGARTFGGMLAGIEELERATLANRALVVRARAQSRALRVRTDRLERARRELRVVERRSATTLAAHERAVGARRATLERIVQRQGLVRARAATIRAQAARRASERLAAAPRPAQPRATPSAEARPDGSRTLVVDAVAYHLPGRTASGLPVVIGVIAVDPAVIPLGTRLFVPGYGPAVAADVGSAVKGNLIDLWMPSTAAARAWGRRTVTITVYG